MALQYAKFYAFLQAALRTLRFLSRFTWRRWLIVYAAIGLFASSPLISVLVASILASAFGCGTVNEASVPDCPGGELVSILFIAGWLALVTIPVGFLLFVAAFGLTLLWLLQAAVLRQAQKRGYTGNTSR